MRMFPVLCTRAVLCGAMVFGAHGSTEAADGQHAAGVSVPPTKSADGSWELLREFPARTEQERTVRPKEGQALWLKWEPLLRTLGSAPQEADVVTVARSKTVIELPRPDGTFERFALVESSIMMQELQAKAPEIRTYLGQGIDNAAATVRLDRTPQGFHAQVLAPRVGDRTGVYYIDPVVRGDRNHYVSHWRGMLEGGHEWTCTTAQPDDEYFARSAGGFSPRGPLTVRRTEYRLAMAATGEYTAFASLPGAPNVLAGLGAIVTTVNRVTQIMENDCAVRLILVADNLNIVYSDAGTDPYSGTSGQKQGQNQSTLDTLIGNANYDVGHLVDAVGGGGNAGGIGTVCSSPNKGMGYTSAASPTGDVFWVDYVAHEIGHQIGATHTFNGAQGDCAGQWTSTTAYEPGSGTSIMGYAGICGSDNLTTTNPPLGASDPMFSFASIQQITLWTNIAPCGTSPTPTANHHPVPFVGTSSYTIPTNTAFSLTGSASDQDFGNAITYSWEQADRGPQRPLGPDVGAHEPLFRTYMHSGNNERVFPTLNPLTGTPMLGENLPLFGRSSEFKLVVRDNVAGGGGVGFGSVAVTFSPSTGGGFRVTEPAAGTYCAGQPIPVIWTVAGTANPPVSCEFVDITLSLDQGQTFSHTLAAGIANSGLALVTLPPLELSNARIKVSAVGNVFYAINPGPMRVQTQPPQFTGFTAWPACSTTCPGASVTIIPSPVSGSEPIELALQKQNGAAWVDARVGTPGDGFFFSPLQRSDAGNYRIVARNGCGTAVTAERRIEVGVTFDSQPQAQTIAPCAPGVLSVQAHGACSVVYQWLYNGAPIVTGDFDGRCSGINGPTLTIGGFRYEDEGTFACRVTDSCETRTSDQVDLTLTTPVWEPRTMNAAPTIAGSAESWVSAYDEHRKVMVLYGGLTSTGQNSNALWEYDGYTWTVRQTGYPAVTTSNGQPLYDGNLPPNPPACAMVYNPDDRKVYFIAPYGWNFPMAICTWDGTNWARPYYGPVNGETARTHAAYDRVGRRVVIVRSIGGTHQSEMLIYDPATNVMTGPTPMQPQVQTGVHDSQLWYDERRGAVIWYNNLNDFVAPTMWTLSAANQWTQLSGNPNRLTYAMPVVYDPVRFQAAGMGGWVSSVSYDTRTLGWPGLQTKRWSSTMPPANDWTLVLPAGPPSNWRPAFWYGMVFDRARRTMVAAGRSVEPPPVNYAWRTYERRYLDRVVFDKDVTPETLAPGNIVRFNSYAAGYPGLAHQWRKDGVNLNDGPAAGGGTLSGTHGAVLTITGVGPADDGAYTCVVTNACGSATTVATRLGCIADFDHAGGLSVQDIFAFLAAWFNNDASADVNGVGGLTVQDVFDFLTAWFGGC